MKNLALAILALTTPFALAQTNPAHTALTPSAKPITFDVVSIQPNHSGSPAQVDHTPPDGYRFENYSVHDLMSNAFGIRYDLISGAPGWTDSEHYDITAKVAGDNLAAWRSLSKDQRNRMLQAVLADRFHLVAHPVIKQLPGYTLTVTQSGFKLQPDTTALRSSWGANLGDIKATAMTISTLADLLSRQLRQSVLDQTGLTGKYTFHLQWADLNAPARPGVSAAEAVEPSGLPALPTALEETLGLKLAPTKVDTTTVVIDSISRPSEN